MCKAYHNPAISTSDKSRGNGDKSQRYLRSRKSTVARANLLAYMKCLPGLEQREAVAHLASMLENPRFERAMSFAAESLEIVELLTEYVQGIRVD